MKPLLTVICLCYNQEKYVEEAIRSVYQQSGVTFECIVVDDCSTDNSQGVIGQLAKEFSFDHVILHQENIGNCKSFNEALVLAKGKYVIDLAADDYFLKGAFQKQIDFFEKQTTDVGMIFSNAELVNEQGQLVKYHFSVNQFNKAIDVIPSGSVFADVLARYFICVPTMVMRKSWLISLNGYNENLNYEDFDLWVRGSLKSDFIYLDHILVAKRDHTHSLSKAMFSTNNTNYFDSTLQVCQFAFNNIRSENERNALLERVKYEGRNASFYQSNQSVRGFKELLIKLNYQGRYLKLKWSFFSIGGKFVVSFKRLFVIRYRTLKTCISK